jgi:hypothetical protein
MRGRARRPPRELALRFRDVVGAAEVGDDGRQDVPEPARVGTVAVAGDEQRAAVRDLATALHGCAGLSAHSGEVRPGPTARLLFGRRFRRLHPRGFLPFRYPWPLPFFCLDGAIRTNSGANPAAWRCWPRSAAFRRATVLPRSSSSLRKSAKQPCLASTIRTVADC